MVKRKLQLCAVSVAVVSVTHAFLPSPPRSFPSGASCRAHSTPGPAEYAVRRSDARSLLGSSSQSPPQEVVPYAPPAGTSCLFLTVGPVLSAALLITGNTVGAGCLVLPELAAGPGLAAVSGMYLAAWALNLLTGLVLAEVALAQHERAEGHTIPSSFQDFAAANLESPMAAHVVASLSLFINACVLAFDFSRAGVFGAGLGLDAPTVSLASAAVVATALTTLSTPQFSLLCNVGVAALFTSFGGLLLPGLAAVPDAAAVWAVPGTAVDLVSSMSATFPIILMSMVFQNIVPVVVKFLNYDRSKSVAAITLGSLIPLGMYVAWCFACLGGGIDTAGGAPLVTLFSVATLAGSSLCTSMSLAEEVTTVLRCCNVSLPHSEASPQADGAVAPMAALPAVALPLVAALVLEGDDGLTVALAIAGSFGSPVLYGLIPALMAWRQRQMSPEEEEGRRPPRQYLIPSATLPVLGALSTGFVGQELWARLGEVVAVAS
jgi:tyrosine-specific transport protein